MGLMDSASKFALPTLLSVSLAVFPPLVDVNAVPTSSSLASSPQATTSTKTFEERKSFLISPSSAATYSSPPSSSSSMLQSADSIQFQDDTITSYSKSSYYATLTLYALSFPGLWSTIKRSTKAKEKVKTFVVDEFAPESSSKISSPKNVSVVAGEIMAYMLQNNYE